ncbi:MAG: glycosyltransferase [Bacteroidota bacterium]
MKNDQQVLVILLPGFPGIEEDSTCLPAQQAIIRQINSNFPFIKLIIFSFQYPFNAIEYNWNNNKVIAFGGSNKGGIARLLLWRRVRQKFNAIKKAHPISGILSFWCGECGLLGKQLGKKNNIRQFCWIMGQDARKENNYVKRINPDGRELIAISDFAREEFNRNHGIVPGHTIPIGIDRKEFDDEPVLRSIDLLAVGSLIPLKQYAIFLEVVASMKRRMPDIKAVLVGDGSEKRKLQTLIKDLGLENNISLKGELPHSKVLGYMQRAKLFLHVSAYEGFGIVCLEALYAGATVISFTKPMDRSIPNWYHASGKEDMISMAFDLLNSSPSYKAELPYTIEETVEQVMSLFSF